jgi:hypothetical protein
MAKRTADQLGVAERDRSRGVVGKEFLFVGDDEDARKIYFEYEESVEASGGGAAAVEEKVVETPKPLSVVVQGGEAAVVVPATTATATIPAVAAIIAQPGLLAAQEEVEDVPITPIDFIVPMVALTLRKSVERVSTSDSVRVLSAGQSSPLASSRLYTMLTSKKKH